MATPLQRGKNQKGKMASPCKEAKCCACKEAKIKEAKWQCGWRRAKRQNAALAKRQKSKRQKGKMASPYKEAKLQNGKEAKWILHAKSKMVSPMKKLVLFF